MEVNRTTARGSLKVNLGSRLFCQERIISSYQRFPCLNKNSFSAFVNVS